MTAREFLTANKDAPEVSQRMLAALAVLGYKGGNIGAIPGFRQLARAPQRDGYDAVVVHHPASRALIYVNRGAEGLKSPEDWIEAAAAALLAKFDGPLKHSVDFLDSTMRQLASTNGLNGVLAAEVDEVLATGHSWGGALSEAQVVFGPSVIGEYFNSLPIAGLGVGSAGFGTAIKAMARARNVAVPADMHWKMHHYIRRADPVLAQPNHSVLGQVNLEPSIFKSSTYVPHRSTQVQYLVLTPALLNHSAEMYFEHFDLPDDQHLYRKRNGDIFLLPGIAPPRLLYGPVDPDSEV
jgi:hypothetical protein